MNLPQHITIDRRVLQRLAFNPCSAWNWYEVAKAHRCRTLDDVSEVAGDWLMWQHMNAATSGFHLYTDLYTDARDCDPHPQKAVITEPYQRLPEDREPPKKKERRAVVAAVPKNGVVEL